MFKADAVGMRKEEPLYNGYDFKEKGRIMYDKYK